MSLLRPISNGSNRTFATICKIDRIFYKIDCKFTKKMHSYHTRQECITHKQNKHSTSHLHRPLVDKGL